ncbi:MAG: GNAT family N-acetyltransferase [Pseudomonadota bacterium]
MKNAQQSSITVRDACREDEPELLELVRGLIVHQRDSLEHFDAATLTRDVFGEDAYLHALVAERDGALIGYAFFHEAYESTYAQRGVYLCDLYVTPGARRSGVGRALVAGVAAAAKAMRRRFVWWTAKDWNEEARGLYNALGAICEPVTAHAVIFDDFDALAEEGSRQPTKPSSSHSSSSSEAVGQKRRR